MPDLVDMKSSIEEAIGWLRRALDTASMGGVEDYETGAPGCWPVMDALALRLQPILKQLESVLPLDPEIEAAIKEEWKRIDDYEDPRTMGLGH
jgi:hypothetical protein